MTRPVRIRRTSRFELPAQAPAPGPPADRGDQTAVTYPDGFELVGGRPSVQARLGISVLPLLAQKWCKPLASHAGGRADAQRGVPRDTSTRPRSRPLKLGTTT